MKRSYLNIPLFALIILLIANNTQSSPLPIAVNDLEAKGIQKSEASIISDKIRTILFDSGKFSVLERAQMEEILKEQGFQQTGCTDQTCAVEIGQLLGVKYMVAGSIGKLGKTFLISLRMIDVATGKVLISEDMDCKCSIEDVLSDLTYKITDEVIKSSERLNSNNVSNTEKFPLIVTTTPAKASVFINNDKKGLTPLNNLPLTKGSYELKLELKGYKSIKENIEIQNEALNKNYTLEKRKNRIISKVSLGVLTAGSAIAGIITNNKAKDHISTSNSIKEDYVTAGTNDNFTTFETRYNTELDEAQKYSLIRNISYGTCVASAIGFTLNFAIK